MRKVLFILFLLSGLYQMALCQNLNTTSKAAEKDYYQGVSQYRLGNNKEALDALRNAIKHDKNFVDAYWVMAEVYKSQENETARINTLKRIAYDSYPNYTQTLTRLGIAQYENGFYEDSFNSFQNIPQKERTGRIQSWIDKCETAIALFKKPIPFEPHNLGPKLNTIYDDYWPSVTADEQTLSMTVLVGKLANSSTTIGFHEEIYHSKKVNGEWTVSKNIGAPMNTTGNEGAQTFSFDGRYMFFVACDRRTGLGGCDIYYSIKNGDTWSTPVNPGEPLNTKFWETSPCFSASGDELYFSSNRPGGKGKKDIWVCKVQMNENGILTFSEPVNAGEPINTVEDEFSPFFHADNKTLYFSSTGHPGLGGYDIFMSRRTPDNKWSPVKNLGYPLNTHRDEIGFVVNVAGDKAYFSSNGIQNNGRQKDIYEVELYQAIRPDPVKYFKGQVTDYDSQNGIQAKVEVFDLNSNKTVYQSVSDNKSGDFLACLPADKEYGFNVSKKGYLFYSGHFDEGDSVHIKVNQEVELPKIETGRKLILRNIFFDFDSYHLKKESRAELDRLCDFLRQYPRVKIQLGGHTDNKGSHEYNIALSRHRAKAVLDYLVKKGIPISRLSCEGFGPDRPIATNDTEEGRALNRRTEAIVVEK
ncbi:MAG: flagellar motor protein MotB [Bacteroidales bacterium]|nr:flagellar motor protein MotB [Bacteroidales bacterium]